MSFPQSNDILARSPSQFDKSAKQILAILDSFFISDPDLKTIKDIFDNVYESGCKINKQDQSSVDYFYSLWNNFLENVDEYFKIPAEKRLEHYIKYTSSVIYSSLSKIETDSQETQSKIHQMKIILNELANKYENDIEFIQDNLCKLQAIIIILNPGQKYKSAKININNKVSLMMQASEEFEQGEKRVKGKQQKLHGFSEIFEKMFGKKERETKMESKIPKPRFLKKEEKIEKEKPKESQENDLLLQELIASQEEEQNLTSYIEEIKDEIADVRRKFAACTVTKKDLKIISDRNEAKLKKQDLQQDIQDMKAKIKLLESKSKNKKKKSDYDEEQQAFFSAEASIQNEYLKNRLRFADQYHSQLVTGNKEFATIIKAAKDYAKGKNESHTVTFSNSKLEEAIKAQEKANDKIKSNIELIIQQQDLYEQDKLLDIQCSSLFEEINKVKNEAERESQRVEEITRENAVLKAKKDAENEIAEENERRLEEEIDKWRQRSAELKKYVVDEIEDIVPKEDPISRNEFDSVQDIVDERSNIQNLYNTLKKSSKDKSKLEALKKKYGKLTKKLNEVANAETYDELHKKESELKVLRDSYEKILNECIERRSAFVNMHTSTGDLETKICMKMRELSKKGIMIDIDDEQISFIANMLLEKLNKASEIKRIYDWLNDHFQDASVQNEQKLDDKLDAALKIAQLNASQSSGT